MPLDGAGSVGDEDEQPQQQQQEKKSHKLVCACANVCVAPLPPPHPLARTCASLHAHFFQKRTTCLPTYILDLTRYLLPRYERYHRDALLVPPDETRMLASREEMLRCTTDRQTGAGRTRRRRMSEGQSGRVVADWGGSRADARRCVVSGFCRGKVSPYTVGERYYQTLRQRGRQTEKSDHICQCLHGV